MGCGFLSTASDKGRGLGQNNGRFVKKTQKIDCRRKSTQFVDVISDNITVMEDLLTQAQRQSISKQLKDHYLFSQLQEEELTRVKEQLFVGKAQLNQYVFRQGDIGNCFFLIAQGNFSVEVCDKVERILGAGESFGQVALIYAAHRTASIKCLSQDNKLLVIKTGVFRQTLRDINSKNYLHIQNLLGKVQAFKYLTNKQKASLSNIMVKTCFRQGEVLFQEGQNALAFYIVMQGKIKIQFKGQNELLQGSLTQFKRKESIIIGQNDSFGENTFFQNGKRKATATALENAFCVSIGKQELQKCLGDSFNNVIHFNIQKWALRQSKIFKGYNNRQLDLFATQFKTAFAKPHETLLVKDQTPSNFIVCLQGKINSQEKGKLFCEENFNARQKRLESNIYKNDGGMYSTLSFSRTDQMMIEIRNRNSHTRASARLLDKQNSCYINLANFQFIKTLGEGQFGIVYLVKDPTMVNAVYALKCLQKQAVISESMESSVVYEKRILESISFPHIVGFVKAFSDKRYIYLLTQFINGMEMFDVIREIGVLKNSVGRFYFGSLMICLEHLHSNNIIYRDLKPENSVVDHKGKVFLIDLGTSKILKPESFYRTFTIIGTPHYLAPEVMQGKGYSFEADFWSMGIVLYQFLCGKLPFGESISDPYSIYAEVMRSELSFPKFLEDQNAKKLIKKLVSKSPAVRTNDGGFKAIRDSPYFEGFDWKALSKESLMPPYIPKKFRYNEPENYCKMKGQNFLQYLYKNNLKIEKTDNFVAQVTEWNEKFQ